MSFGFSPGDLVSLANVAHTIYTAFKNSSGDLRQKLSTFEDVSQELIRLNKVLEGAGIHEYPDTAELEKSLSEALEYFQQYKPLLPGQGKFLSKVASTAKFSLDKAVVERYSQEMKRHRKKMHKFTMDVILYKTLHDSQLQQTFLYAMTSAAGSPTRARHHSIEFFKNETSDNRLLERSADNDQAIASSVRRAIGWTSYLNDSDSLPSNTIPLPAQTQNSVQTPQPLHSANDTAHIFATIVTDLAEASIRYLSDAPTSAPLDEVEQTINFLNQFKETVTGSPNFSPVQTQSKPRSSLCLPYRSPSIVSGGTTDAESNLNLPVLTFSRSGTASTLATSVMTSPTFTEYQIGEPSINTDTIIPQSESSMSVLSRSDVQNTLVLKSAISGEYQIPCKVKSSSKEVIVTLSTPLVDNKTLMATPGQILGVEDASRPFSDSSIFEHYTEQLNSFPVIFHPAADVSTSTSNFLVHFYQPQSFSKRSDNSRSTRRTVRYVCKNRSDRKVLCEMLFGKKLLASAGIEKTSVGKSCHQQTLMIWLDRISQMTGGPSVSITIPSNSSGKCSQPDHIQEYIVESCPNIEKARERGKKLILTLRSKSDPQSPTAMDHRRESDLSIRSSTTVRSWSSSSSTWRRSSISAQIPCEITFSEDTEKFRQKKREFIDALARVLGS